MGALATILCSGVAPLARGANGFQIYGAEGTIRYLFEMGSNIILAGRSTDSELREVPIPPEEERHWTAELDFINAVREGRRAVEPTFWDGLKYMELTEAIFRSIETGRTVTLPSNRAAPSPPPAAVRRRAATPRRPPPSRPPSWREAT